MFLKNKICGKIKGRGCGNGQYKRQSTKKRIPVHQC